MLLLLLGLFALGLRQLFVLRFRGGDIYPPYSSLRSDPLGAKALYESFSNLPGLSVSRNYKPLDIAQDTRDSTIFFLGAEPWMLHSGLTADLQAFATSGGRVVISLLPVTAKPLWEPFSFRGDPTEEEDEKEDAGEEEEGEEAEEQDREAQEQKTQEERSAPPTENWDVSLDYSASAESRALCLLTGEEDGPGLEPSISWHTILFFDDPGKDWNVIYSRDDKPVLIERRRGRGTIVLSADSYFFSNEAMSAERLQALLAWLAGASGTLVFEETHLGTQERRGVAALARGYGLQGTFAVLILLAVLFIWKSIASFVPPYKEHLLEEHSGFARGRDELAGLVSLLRRNIPKSGILDVCYRQWARSVAHRRKSLHGKYERVQAVIETEKKQAARERTPVEDYQAICRILAERGGK